MPKVEHPGVYVEEVGGAKPIDGVPTDDDCAPAWVEGPWFLRSVFIGGAILACLGILLAIVRGGVMVELMLIPGCAAVLVALFISAVGLWILRVLVEWRRKKAGRPRLGIGNLMFGMAAFSLASLVAANVGMIAFAASLFTGPPFTSVLFAVGTNLLLGYLWLLLATRALRDFALLVQAVRTEG